MMLWWLMKGCMGQRFCNAVVWIAELLRVKKSWKLVEISFNYFILGLVELIFKKQFNLKFD